jgi:hypothetical protein
MTLVETDDPPFLSARLIDPDGAELENWAIPGYIIPIAGSTSYLYELIVMYRNVQLDQPGRHEIRIQYDVDRPELAVEFEIEEIERR